MSSRSNGYYICFDGDRIGEVMKLHLVSNDLQSANNLSKRLDSRANEIVAALATQGATLVFRGGDSLIFHSPNGITDANIPHVFSDLTFSVGIGASVEQAAIALFKAKAMGRARIVRT